MEKSRVLTALSAMAHETRLEIVRLLVPCKGNGMAAGAIAETLSISPSGLTFHLNSLEQAGLIGSKRQGRQVIYATNTDTLGGVIAYLVDDCCGRDPDVCKRTQLGRFTLPDTPS